MNQSILFITPPFTQLNTPYPASACLKGFMNTQNIQSHQYDLGIEVILALFSQQGLRTLFNEIDARDGGQHEKKGSRYAENIQRMVQMQEEYIATIGPVINFLQGRSPELAHLICSGHWLPEGDRFDQVTDPEYNFGHLGIQDQAKYLATLYLDDISDLIRETADPHFGFSRYAEHLGSSAGSFDDLEQALTGPGSFIDLFLTRLLEEKILRDQPTLVAISVPFPGNLYSALKCGQWIRLNHPEIKIAVGGGFVKTELRSVADPRVFDYVDFITLDDGETPLLHLVEYLDGQRTLENMKRTFMRLNGEVVFLDGSLEPDVAHSNRGTPDYSGLPLDKYLSVIEMANPMHRLWSDGRWNKLMLAHGCYWGKCTFCDVTLDYIKRYDPGKPALICDRMEAIMLQTGHHGFHFTDEAAPPALLRDLALEILRRKLTVAWWTNIRFEISFSRDLCLLLRESGCIAVSGGLEVASDRILKMINKGVTVSQVARVADNFTRAGIMVHAYLMYGFPTQTAQETVDSLEVVRQLFMHGAVQSAFWHRFAMTAHSPAGLDPEKFGVERADSPVGAFANNDLVFTDRKGCAHETFGEGLKKSLYNYMHDIGFELPLQEWFDFRIPRTTVPGDFIRKIVSQPLREKPAPHARAIWLGGIPEITFLSRQKKGRSIPSALLTIQTHQKQVTIQTGEQTGKWLMDVFPHLIPGSHEPLTFMQLESWNPAAAPPGLENIWDGPVMKALRENGLLFV
ncbi:MAG: B12-binding domain-containing radical SAM protein [Bacteroidetes bacterium]|nr:B12-binding domain-containing radical SAM protein [Bacteroidota bacterium]